MHPQARRLALVLLIGGPLVLASYAWCLIVWPELSAQMWGGVPEAWRGPYTAWMFVAAAGFLAFSWVFVFRTQPETKVADQGYELLIVLYSLVLFPSALWMPATAWLLHDPSPLLHSLVRLDLYAVALGSIGLIVAAFTLRPRPAGRVLAIVGTLAFAVQTVVLDALVWPALFSVP
jgi:hypothetical protein